VVRDGVRGGGGGTVSVGVRVPGGIAVEFRGNVTVGVKVLAGVVVVIRDGVWGGVGGLGRGWRLGFGRGKGSGWDSGRVRG
jgi:hypothetical protein